MLIFWNVVRLNKVRKRREKVKRKVVKYLHGLSDIVLNLNGCLSPRQVNSGAHMLSVYFYEHRWNDFPAALFYDAYFLLSFLIFSII